MAFDEENKSLQEPNSPRVIAITGASGFVGKHLLSVLAKSQHELRVLTRSGEGEPRVVLVRGDLLRSDSLGALVRGADTVIHAAGFAHTTLRTPTEHAIARTINVRGTRDLVRVAMDAGVQRFIYLSSAHVYAGQRGIDISETSSTADDGGYAGMKLAAEFAVLKAGEIGLGVTILRPCLVYGPGVKANLLSLLRGLQRGLYVHARGINVLRSMVSVDTVAMAIDHMIQSGETGIFNVADAYPVLLESWVNQLADMMQIRHPRSVPLHLLRVLATFGTVAATMGLPSPFTRSSLDKLVTSFSLNVDKLTASGFVWPGTERAVMQEMVMAFLFRNDRLSR